MGGRWHASGHKPFAFAPARAWPSDPTRADLRARARPVAATDHWDQGRLRRAFGIGVLRAVLIDRATGGRAALAEGASLILFPKGGRFPGPLPRPFKSGLHHLAKAHAEVELIPVWLEKSGRALPKGASIPVPVSASAAFGAPVALDPVEDRDAFLILDIPGLPGALAMAAVVVAGGAPGGRVLSAVRRSLGAKDWGSLVEGQGGMLDRMDSLAFSAPVFFPLTHHFWA